MSKQKEIWEKLRDRREVLLKSGEILNKNLTAEQLLSYFFSDTVVKRALKTADEDERGKMISIFATTLLEAVGKMRVASTFGRDVRDKKMQFFYGADNPASALRQRVAAELERLIEAGFLDPLEDLLPKDLQESHLVGV